ncbi:MAG: aminoglycoside phosphotransferase family protein, partial [Clostridium sp.]
EIKAELFKYIDKLPDGNILCHGDFHPDNVIVTKNKEIIIDWMTATKGNKLADIARTCVMLRFGVVPNKSSIETKIINFGRNKLYEAYLNHYVKISGVTHEEIRMWELPVAAARLVEYLPKSEKDELVNFINAELMKT